jgi:hypothetical protein
MLQRTFSRDAQASRWTFCCAEGEPATNSRAFDISSSLPPGVSLLRRPDGHQPRYSHERHSDTISTLVLLAHIDHDAGVFDQDSIESQAAHPPIVVPEPVDVDEATAMPICERMDEGKIPNSSRTRLRVTRRR